jgi:hypothetical protein
MRQKNFNVPGHLLGLVQAFVTEVCEQSLEQGLGPVMLHVTGKNEAGLFTARLVGNNHAVKVASPLVKSAENGVFNFPSPNNRTSIAIGQPGDKIDVPVRLYSKVCFSGWFGDETLYRFRTLNGSELSWRTTSSTTYEKGDYHMTARVKEHVVHDGTTITRVNYVKLRGVTP